MLHINCYVGFLRPTLRIPHLYLANRSISEYFERGSMDAAGNPGLRLTVDEMSRVNHCQIPADRPTSYFYLHEGLSRLTRNRPYQRDINSIGLIIADRFVPRPGLLGMMFDFGFDPEGLEPISQYFKSVPREGCAIFTEAIRDIRSGERFDEEVVFTAIHEIGHVFNLWHTESPITFMNTSQNSAPYSSRAYFFNPVQRRFLNNADNFHVRPGGSEFRDRGTLGPSLNNPFENNNYESKVELKIDINQKEFWYFEPVELDVVVAVKNNQDIEAIPDKVDPGYDNFEIYITRPDGTVFKYKSPKIYCQNDATITIKKGKPFQRDISIFGQSGGYTFKQHGEYIIQCSFEVKPNSYIFSNILKIFVKEPMFDNATYIKRQRLLASKPVGLLLYHRSGFFNPMLLDEIEQNGHDRKNRILSNNISYALSKYMVHTDTKLNKKDLSKVSKLTNTALDSGALSNNKIKNLTIIKDKFNI